jgi:hypothetical protein
MGGFSKNIQVSSFSEAQGVRRKSESLRVIKLRRDSEHNPLEEEPFHFQGRVDEIRSRRSHIFPSHVRSGKVAQVLTLEALQTS